jgi:hypothetical protein
MLVVGFLAPLDGHEMARAANRGPRHPGAERD